jgi:hypothetical protein
MTSVTQPSPPTIADVFGLFGQAFLEQYPQPPHHHRLIRWIQICRTAKLGGHLQKCDDCDYSKPAYNSCRCRLCPQCGTLKKERWVEARKSELIPCPYFHGVFTIPHELNALVLRNKTLLYGILFETVNETLQDFTLKRWGKGAQLGVIAVLHTWNQKLSDHIHLHCVIPGGAMQPESSHTPLIQVESENFLFPVHALSQVFKAKFIDRLRRARAQLAWPRPLAYCEREDLFSDFLETLWKREWVVYAKRPFRGPEQVIEYLGRYTHKTAHSNRRIVKIEGDRVFFKYRDRKDGDTEKVLDLPAVEFLRRFMLHALPKGFQRIRHFGFLANRKKKQNLARILRAVDPARLERLRSKPAPPITAASFLLENLGIDITRCPRCGKGELHAATLASRPP